MTEPFTKIVHGFFFFLKRVKWESVVKDVREKKGFVKIRSWNFLWIEENLENA